MQRHAADRATKCDHCNGHARSARCFANLGGKYREDEINQTGVRQDNTHWHAVDVPDPMQRHARLRLVEPVELEHGENRLPG